jgi:hypothetical protein
MKMGIGVVVVVVAWAMLVMIVLIATGCQPTEPVVTIDPNDEIYSFLLKPPASWTDKHGSDERSVLIFNVSAASALAQNSLKQTRALTKHVNTIHDPNMWVDPNAVAK